MRASGLLSGLFRALVLLSYIIPGLSGPLLITGTWLDKDQAFTAANLGINCRRCIVEHVDLSGINKTYEFYPSNNHPRIKYPLWNYETTCSFLLTNVKPEDAGNWTIKFFGSEGNEISENPSGISEITLKIYDLPKATTTEPTIEPTTEPVTVETTPQEVTTELSTITTPVPVERIDSHLGNYVQFNSYHKGRKVIQCIATNNGNVYEIYPRMNLTNGDYKGGASCTFFITSLRWENSGTWILTSLLKITSDEGIEEVVQENDIYELGIQQELQALPAQSVTMNNGYATFYIPKTFKNPTSCLLTNNKGSNYELINNDVDESEGIELFDTCGVRMRVDQSRVGTWILQQSRGDYEQVFSQFTIKPHSDTEHLTTHHLFWHRGGQGSIELYQHSNVFCEVVRPDGVVIDLTDESCKYEVNNVDDAHAGVWKARYGVPYRMNLLVEDIIVEVWNPEAIEMSVSRSEDGINLLCRTGLVSLNSCTFQMPNGTILSLRPSMGDGNYEYYGNGFSASGNSDYPKKAECGLTIRNPSSSDYGLWKCSMRREGSVRHGIINVLESREGKISETEASSSEVFVKRGDGFTIKCQTDTPLRYCWLRSPNGTMYSVTKTGSGENFLRYNGEGLSMGVCGAIVENAGDTDNGDWSCRLGVVGNAEVETIVPVTVTESRLIPLMKNMSISRGSVASLSCRTFPSAQSTIDYCRWVRPNGHGIYRDSLSSYSPSYDNTTCTLTINEVTSADYGTWTCYAGLSSGSNEEVYSKIELHQRTTQFTSTTVTLNALAITLVLTALFGSCFLGIVFYRRKNLCTSRPASPPSYYEYNTQKNMEIKVNPDLKY